MSSSTPQNTKAQRLQDRTAQRAATADRKRKVAEALKDKGNEFYRKGKYEEAVKCYEDAILAYGPRAVYLNNLSAALLKLDRPTEAEAAASSALHRDHKLLKARFRRGLARKLSSCLHGALIDFQNVLKQDPTCAEARAELREVEELLTYAPCEDSVEEMSDDAKPLQDDPGDGNETGFESDSTDYRHGGNGTPCRFYNHDGCSRGAQCKFKHAPDGRSVRDKLGRNVCVLYLLGLCHFPETKCWYAHDKAYLPPLSWDSDPSLKEMQRTTVSHCLKKRAPIKLEPFVRLINLNETGPMMIPRLRRELFAESSEYRSPWSGILDYEPDADEVPDWANYDDDFTEEEYNYNDDDDEDDDDDGLGENGMLGFSEDDVQELLAQGVKPWDDDAADVLAALNSY